MTSLRERFTADMKEAMKAGEKAKVAAKPASRSRVRGARAWVTAVCM